MKEAQREETFNSKRKLAHIQIYNLVAIDITSKRAECSQTKLEKAVGKKKRKRFLHI